ncbi:unnamed protein product [Brachionus calyciflorus]|uniref:Fungal lipase-type domain-containing protein n=1 Tax=Brachionus calyciflorus TaxID=104777 RepID=A0A814AA17_9BILA|nr:unnamed protein product [Brachionus calyciflorus]
MNNFPYILNNEIKSIDEYNYNEILYLCSLGSCVIYEDDPLKELCTGKFSSIDHSISKMCVTQTITSEISSLKYSKYMIYESSKLNKINFISFRGTKNLQYFLTEINSTTQDDDLNLGNFHTGIYKFSNLIDDKNFINLLKEGKKLYFTGHSIGAAISCMLVIKLISKIEKHLRSNIFFIGFGCPLFSDEKFAENFTLKNNFHFIQIENDIVVPILKDLSTFFHDENNKINILFHDLFKEFLKTLSQFIFDDKQDNISFSSFINQDLNKSNNSSFQILVEAIQNNLSLGIKSISNFSPKYCLFGKIHKFKDNNLIFSDEQVKNENFFKEILDGSFIENVSNHKISEYWSKFKTVLHSEEVYKQKEIESLVDLELSVESIENEAVKNEYTNNFINDKEMRIQDMPFDMLYISAAFYVHIIGKLDLSNNNPKLLKNKNDLLIIFEEVDKIWNEKLKTNWKKCSPDIKKQLREKIFSNLDVKDSNIIEQKISEDFIFNESLSNLKEAVTYESNAFGIIKKLYPIVYELKKQFCKEVIKKNWHKVILRPKLAFIEFKYVNEILSYYFASKKFDDTYRTFLLHILKSNKLGFEPDEQPNLGFIEKLIFINLIDNFIKMDSDYKKLIELTVVNLKIRNIICQDYFVGVVGTKKSGKTTFTNLITCKDSNSSMSESTETVKSWNLYNKHNLFLIDYPHFDSPDISNQLEFHFSRTLLNRVFVIFEAKSKGQIDGNKKILQLVRQFFSNRFTVLYNFSDLLIDEKNIDLEKFKEEICSNLGIHDNQEKENVFLTCLDPHLDRSKADRIKLTKIIKDRKQVEKLFYELVIKKDNNHIVDKALVEKFEQNEKEITAKTIEILDSEGSKKVYALKRYINRLVLNRTFIWTFEELIKRIQKNFEIENPKIYYKWNPNLRIEKFEDFFKNELTVFVLE